jgi:hypothetical protein
MSLALRKIQRDFIKHRKKAALLALLFAVMLGLTIKAYFDIHPTAATAQTIGENPLAGTATNSAAPDGATAAEADERIRQSKELWRVLREVRGVPATVAFAFDSTCFTPEPSRQVTAQPTAPVVAAVETPLVIVDTGKAQKAHLDELERLTRSLKVRSTIMSSADNKPRAIVNQQLLTIGDSILGFEITAIRAREVDFTRDGVTFAVKMPDDQRGS